MKHICFLALGCGLALAAEQDWAMAAMQRSNGIYSLHEAAGVGCTATLKARVAEGANVNARDEAGDTPLLVAVKAGQAQAAELLLAAGADPLPKDAAGHTPAELAADAALAELCRSGEADRRRELELVAAIEADDLSAVVNLLENGVNPDALAEDGSANALLLASVKGNSPMVTRLLAAGASVNTVLPDKSTALHRAAAAGKAEVVAQLLAAGADPMAKAGNGSTPLHEAVWFDRRAAVEVLLPAYKGCNFSPEAGWISAPVNMAVAQDNAAMVELICKAGYNPNKPLKGQEPALIAAVKAKNPALVRILLAAGADTQLKDNEGKTAIDYAEGDIARLLK